MKRHMLLLIPALAATSVRAQPSTINPTNQYAWSCNSGWIDFRAERRNTDDGFRFGEFACSGYLWSPNLGWINCGNGAPTNGISYANNSHADFGVNHSGTGDLYGLAWAANVGWINFSWWTLDPNNTNRPRVNLVTGEFAGYVWSPNCGWINLGTGQLKTDRMEIVDTDDDGISDAFERAYAGNLKTMDSKSDFDGDTVSDKGEYIAGTNPADKNEALKITRISKLKGNVIELEWSSNPARVYGIEAKPSVEGTNWFFLGDVAGFAGANTMQAIEASAPQAFFRIQAKLPLQP